MNLPDPVAAAESPHALEALNRWLAGLSAQERIEWALRDLAGEHALSSSFGAQAAVSLHLATQAKPDLPVILIDTGYLFPEIGRRVRAFSAANPEAKVIRLGIGDVIERQGRTRTAD